MKAAHILLLVLINLVWAGNVISTKELVTMAPPLLAMALRFVGVLLVCAPFLKIVPGKMRLILLTGLLAGALQFGFYGIAYHASDNVSALAIAGQMGVPFSLLLAIWIDGERIAWIRSGGIALAVAGVCLLVFDPHIADERLPLLYTVLATLCWAASNLMVRRLTGIPVLRLYAWQAVISLPTLVLASALAEPGAMAALPDAPLMLYVWIAYSALLSSIVGHAGVSWLLQRYPVSTITPLTLPTPVIAVILASIVYRTVITPMMIIGGIMALAGVAIISLRGGSRATTTTPTP